MAANPTLILAISSTNWYTVPVQAMLTFEEDGINAPGLCYLLSFRSRGTKTDAQFSCLNRAITCLLQSRSY